MLRFFKYVESPDNIHAALARAVPVVAKSFFIQAIVMCVFSILAFELYENIVKVCDADGIFGPWCFGSFPFSLCTCVQVYSTRRSFQIFRAGRQHRIYNWVENMYMPVWAVSLQETAFGTIFHIASIRVSLEDR